MESLKDKFPYKLASKTLGAFTEGMSSELQLHPACNLQATNNYYLKHSYALRSVTSQLRNVYVEDFSYNHQSSVSNISNIQPRVTRTDKLSTTYYTPVRLLRNEPLEFFKLQYGNPSSFKQKPTSSNFYLVVKQKRYAPTSMVSNKFLLDYRKSLIKTNFKASEKLFLSQQNSIRSEIVNVQSNRRLLRTRRVLVLPAHTNITLITNSFDVMHSWFIPGLGVKLDCVPGRSTHHTIHIDHAGFYYGQCAEICGRYHHHMPIRVCALPFEHFLI